jgi:hypothetical protein
VTVLIRHLLFNFISSIRNLCRYVHVFDTCGKSADIFLLSYLALLHKINLSANELIGLTHWTSWLLKDREGKFIAYICRYMYMALFAVHYAVAKYPPQRQKSTGSNQARVQGFCEIVIMLLSTTELCKRYQSIRLKLIFRNACYFKENRWFFSTIFLDFLWGGALPLFIRIINTKNSY